MDQEKLLLLVSARYGLAPLKLVGRPSSGFLTENFIVGDRKIRYFLKQYRSVNPKRIAETHAVKQYFHTEGFPVILPLKDQAAQTFFSHEEKLFALFPFVEGIHLHGKDIPPQGSTSFATMLAKMHLVGKGIPVEITEEIYPLSNTEKQNNNFREIDAWASATPTRTEIQALSLESANIKRKLLQKLVIDLETLNLTCDHLIHGDYLSGNVYFNEHGTVSHLFDFEKTVYAPRGAELFRAGIYSFAGKTVTEEDFNRCRIFLKEYLAVYPMPQEELARSFKFYMAKTATNIWYEHEYLVKKNLRLEPLASIEHSRAKWFLENHARLEDYFLNLR